MQRQIKETDSLRVGLYLGRPRDSPSNITKVLKAWDSYLDPFDTEVFGSAELPDTATNTFDRVPIEAPAYPTPFGKIAAIYHETKKYVKRRDPDILVQFWKYNTHASGVALASAKTGTPFVARLSSDAFNEYQQCSPPASVGVMLLNNMLGRIPLSVADTVITLGPYGKEQACNRGADPDTVRILPPPASTEDRFAPTDDPSRVRLQLELPQNEKVALYVGRLTSEKGMDFLRKVANRASEYTFVLLGEGPYQGFPQNVRTPGYVPHEEIHRYYQAADVYVHPSPLEGIPLVIIEALNCELPVVAREAGDIGFVTDNIVESPEQMATVLQSDSISTSWQNRDLFDPEVQAHILREIVREAATTGK